MERRLERRRLEGKVAVVTGAGGGIGAATARMFARHGARVFCVDWNADAGERTAAAVRNDGGEAFAVDADVGDEADAASIISTCVARFGRLDVYFANAGVSGSVMASLTKQSANDVLNVFRTNVVGVFLGIKLAAQQMKLQRSGGSILCTASIAGMRAGAGPVAYSASKAAVISLVQTTAFELAGTGIRVNALCPGLIETNMTAFAFDYARSIGVGDRIGELNALQRAGEPSEVAHAALFLASDESSYITGQALVVDGGLTSAVPQPLARF